MGVYTCRMIRCCLHHYFRNCTLCLSLALFMLTLNGIFLSASNPGLPICFLFSVIRSHWPCCHINPLWQIVSMLDQWYADYNVGCSDLVSDKVTLLFVKLKTHMGHTLPTELKIQKASLVFVHCVTWDDCDFVCDLFLCMSRVALQQQQNFCLANCLDEVLYMCYLVQINVKLSIFNIQCNNTLKIHFGPTNATCKIPLN